jgi:co-chaperonin GroES (HSP10)
LSLFYLEDEENKWPYWRLASGEALTCLPGKMIVLFDPAEQRSPSGRIILPTKRHTWQGLCLVHVPSVLWAEPEQSGKRILAEAWGHRSFKLRGTDYALILEQSCLATLEEGE